MQETSSKKKKKILLLSDDLRLNSGIATVSRDLVIGTADKFDWVQLGAAIKHPDTGKAIDLSEAIRKDFNIPDAYVRIYPCDGYGNLDIVRQLINIEQPDCILHFTDPRFWGWLYAGEHELRQMLPIFYLNIWDNWPAPSWNKPFYLSCDMLMGISKQTVALNKAVLKGEKYQDWQLKYLPHGINSKTYYPIIPASAEYAELKEYRSKLGISEGDFVVYYNARNIRRKHTSDVLLAYNEFVKKLPKEKAKKCVLLMHTQPVDENGTDLYAVQTALTKDLRIIYSAEQVLPKILNFEYNIADVTINLASNEGFGLGTAESVMAGTPIIVNVTGGLQDQCGFKKSDGTFLTVDDYTEEWGTNNDGKYKDCGEWAFPVFPAVQTMQGSPVTPYIWDDIADYKTAADVFMTVYELGYEERKGRGLAGREHFMKPETMLSSVEMCNAFDSYIDTALENWTPRKRFTLYQA